MDGSGPCLLSALWFFSCSSSVNSAFFPFGADGVGSSPPSIWGYPSACASPTLLCGTPSSWHYDYPAVGIRPSLESWHQWESSQRLMHSLWWGKVYFLPKILSWKNMNQDKLLAIFPAPRTGLSPMRGNKTKPRRWANGEIASPVSWELALVPEPWGLVAVALRFCPWPKSPSWQWDEQIPFFDE